MAYLLWESRRCPTCKNYDSIVEFGPALRDVTWEEHGNRVYRVHQYRCLACGASDLIQRDWMRKHEKDEPLAGQSAAADGRMFAARPLPPSKEA